jgi:glycosyltransferase involved in cell wall biosynthesis
MKRILIITSILPISNVKSKQNENDIILRTENNLIQYKKDVLIEYIFIQPRSNFLLSLLNRKWKEYYQMQKKSEFEINGKKIKILSLIMLPKQFLGGFFFNLSFFSKKSKLKKIILELKPDVIHAQDVYSAAFIARKLSKKFSIPYMVTLRYGYTKLTDLIKKNILYAKTLVAITPAQIKRTSLITTKSVHLIPHGVEPQFYQRKNSLNITSPIKLVFVGRIIKIKNIEIIINSILDIGRNLFLFDIYGDGDQFKNLEKLIINKGLQNEIKLKGKISHEKVSEILPMYDLFVMPSFPETFGRVYLEAMASSLPVIAAKNTGIDGFIEDGREGFLVDVSSGDELTERFKFILDSPDILVEMSNNAFNFAQKYSWKKIIDILDDAYFNVINEVNN